MISPEFFLNAVTCICNDTDIYHMLHNTLTFLAEHINIDALAFSRFEEKKGTVHRLALCRKDGSEEGESVEKLPDKILEFARNVIHSHKRCVLTSSVANNPVRTHMYDCGRSRFQSAIVLHLYLDDTYFASVDAFAEKPDSFSANDARMFELLAVPFTLFLHRYLKSTTKRARAYSRKSSNFPFIGSSAPFINVCRLARDVAPTITPVLITGETGTGKEIMANFIQYLSNRANKPFITVNCAAIPPNLMENEFFGHEAHAFTGAGRIQKGRFELADGGTLFLDEIGELPLEAQSKLLRVLEYKQMERLGSSTPIQLNIRIIAATNRNLEQLVQQGLFRQDLYYRLNIFPIVMPPLRERKQDIPDLVHFLLQKKQRELELPVLLEPSQDELALLMEYDWPGNIRELSNVVEQALILSQRTKQIHFQLKKMYSQPSQALQKTPVSANSLQNFFSFNDAMPVMPLKDMEKNCILHALRKTNGKLMGKNSASELLGINGYTLRSRMVKLGLDPKKRTAGI